MVQVGGLNFSMVVNQMRIDMILTLIAGTRVLRGYGLCRIEIGRCKSAMGSCEVQSLQEPEADIRRTTASLQYNRTINHGYWATAFVWGRNHVSSPGEIHNLNGYTIESTINFLDRNYVYTRLELVDKDDLLRPSDRALLGITNDHPSFRIGGYTFGGVRDVWNSRRLSLAIGSDLTFYSKPAVLDQILRKQSSVVEVILPRSPSEDGYEDAWGARQS